MRKHVERINRAITFVFYALIITTPLAMHPSTHELFEFNKMWLVFIYSLVIFFLWGIKMLIQRRFEIRRTPFDIPLMLFLVSQVASTIFSLDQHTSFWGYYTRFNGGLLSTISYIFLYYAFVTNVLNSDREESVKKASRMLLIAVISGVIVALWGLPSHFGYDPTCLAFRGSFDVACWTEAFQPKVRMFSTLGQPNWLAAFLAILIPIAMAFMIEEAKKIRKSIFSLPGLLTGIYALIIALFYFDLSWTLSQSGYIGFWIGNLLFATIFTVLTLRKHALSIPKALKQRSFQALLVAQFVLVLTTFLSTTPIPRFQKFNISYFMESMAPKKITRPPSAQSAAQQPAPVQNATQPSLEASITGSGDIRKIVWKGAIDIFKANPLFGSGVETFAFAYYKFRPAEHNLTSEWDYLYNKAHNEFLNYLATTGAFGLGTYLLFIFAFLYYALRHHYKHFNKKTVGNPLLPALVGSFIAIHIIDFFGFSVVNVNLMLFLIPAFYWGLLQPDVRFFIVPGDSKADYVPSSPLNTAQIMGMIGVGIFSVYCIMFLVNYWNADIAYALGYNYQHVNEFQQANPYLEKAVQMRDGEDLYKNELSVNLAALALTYAQQKDTANTAQYATRAKQLSDDVSMRNPNNVVYWKTRTRVMYSLAQLNAQLFNDALASIEKSAELAPTDAKILYNKALLYDQAGKKEQAVQILDQTINLKKNYRDAYYAKALIISQIAEKEKDPKKSSSLKQQARETLQFTLTNILQKDQDATKLLESLK